MRSGRRWFEHACASIVAAGRRSAPAAAEIDATIAKVRDSGLFDADWYLARNPDVAAAGLEPVRHYIMSGAAEGRRASPNFDPVWYLGEHPEVARPGLDPFLHFIMTGRALGYTPRALDDGQAFDSFLAATRSGALPFTGRIRDEIGHVHYPFRPRPPADPLPWPPPSLLARIGSLTRDDFEEVGRDTTATIVRCLPAGFDFRGARVLDFGCGVGRVIRHFATEARTAEIWGADIDGTSIRWSVENLTPPFRFYQMSGAPSLPFEDSSLDLIYAIAVFSQVYEGWHHWAMELRRVLKPGGIVFMSYAGQAPFEEMVHRPFASFDPHPGFYVKDPFKSWNRGGPMVFLSPAWVERYWGSIFDIDFIAPDALNDDQSICVMRKPEAGTPPRPGARIVETATRQAFHADAVGRIAARFDATTPFLDGYGVEVSGPAEISGWIALRADTPEKLALAIDGAAIASETAWAGGPAYRDWADTVRTGFRTRFDAGPLAKGRGRLSVRISGRRGTTHEMSIALKVG